MYYKLAKIKKKSTINWLKQNKTYRRPSLVVSPLKVSLKGHFAHGTQAKTLF